MENTYTQIYVHVIFDESKWIAGRFNWQEGFGALSYSHSQLDVVAQYIRDQEKHHTRKRFQDEYMELLRKFNVDYNPKYVFDWLDSAE